ncbi:MAG: hypothetical protein KGO96_00365 [Elusimicrobia bacterium]|nr:hypothetical protein [Elusimicrobiota bacterium]MDE2236576.1 hypothetical protein [Elusimicrobiota bacterium]MDE2424347.1 hypothetical protein [Elusimicrobiota bacterium]
MTRKDLRLALVCLAAAFWALWPAWLNPRLATANFGDLYAFHYPLRHLVVEALQSGRLPWWNPYVFSGLPLAANPQAATFYPVSALGFFLPLTLALSWDQLFHLCWALLGAALLARKARLPAAAAWAAGLLYAFSPMLIFRVTEGIPTLLAALSWIPWCWLAWLWGKPGWLGLVWALQLLSGHPQFALINVVGMGLFALASPGRWRRLLRLAREGLWALGLSALQWLPTREFLEASMRRSWPGAYAFAYSIHWSALGALLGPGLRGNPMNGSFAGFPSVFFETRTLFLGWSGLALAALALARRPRWAPCLLAGAGILLAFGGGSPFYRFLRAPLSSLRVPARWLLLPLWALWLEAASGSAWLARRGRLAAAFVLLLCLAEPCARDARYLGVQRADQFLAPNRAFALAMGGSSQRLITDPALANPDKTALYHTRNVNGYDAFYLDGYAQYAARSEGHAAADSSRVYFSTLGTPQADRLGAAWRVSARGKVLHSKTALPLAYFVDAAGAPVAPAPALDLKGAESWRVRGAWPKGARRLVLSQPSYPGWKAWLNGRRVPLPRWDGLLQSVRRPAAAGRFELDLRYSPTGWPLWLGMSLLFWLAWILSREAAA